MDAKEIRGLVEHLPTGDYDHLRTILLAEIAAQLAELNHSAKEAVNIGLHYHQTLVQSTSRLGWEKAP